MQQQYPDRTTLESSDGTRAVIVPELGGTVASLYVPTASGPRDVLFRHPHFWDSHNPATRGGIPILFPVCGRLRSDEQLGRYTFDGRVYTLPLHGFAMRKPWRIRSRTLTRLELMLESDADTRSGYPFAFSLRMCFEVGPAQILLEFEAYNDGDVSMPFSAGWHPYFLTPAAKAGKADVQVHLPIHASGRYDDTYTAIPSWDNPLPNPLSPMHPLFKEMLHRANGDTVTIAWPDGFRLQLQATVDDFAPVPFWQLHTDVDQPFICVEPWSSPPNALNTGESLINLQPGRRWRMRMVIKSQSGP